MGIIKVKCPTCGKVLGLNVNDDTNLETATFKCTTCNERHKVKECQRIAVIQKPDISNEETQYGRSAKPSSGIDDNNSLPSSIGTLVDSMGRTYPLALGMNTIGRKAKSSSATVQIIVSDRYMSRNHAIIEVKQSGGKLLHILRNDINKNPSYLNGAVLAPQDQFILNNGDHIKMGLTDILFKIRN